MRTSQQDRPGGSATAKPAPATEGGEASAGPAGAAKPAFRIRLLSAEEVSPLGDVSSGA